MDANPGDIDIVPEKSATYDGQQEIVQDKRTYHVTYPCLYTFGGNHFVANIFALLNKTEQRKLYVIEGRPEFRTEIKRVGG